MTDTTFTTREVPWMKLGKLIDEPLDSTSAIKAAGLDFTVSIRNTCYTGSDGTQRDFPSRKTIARDDTDEPFEVVSDIYPILQYSEAFDFADKIPGKYVAAGALKGGRQGFLVKQPEANTFTVGGDDDHEMFFVIRTSHDRTRAIEIMIMPLRMKCMNQLTLSTFSKDVKNRWAITHTSNMRDKMHQAEKAVGNLAAYTESFESTAKRLIDSVFDNDHATWVLQQVLADRPKRDETIDTILSMWKTAPTVGYAGTGWGLVNAVSEYYDWGRSGGTAESRFTAALQGQTQKAINKTATYVLTRR